MKEKHEYEVNLQWLNGRKGLISSPILTERIEVVTPPEFPNGIAGSWSPEHLFVAAVNSCLMTTFLSIAENSKIDFISFESNAVGIIEKVEGKWLVTEIILKPILTIHSDLNPERALRILEMSEKACMISNSIKSTIIFEPQIKTQ